MNLRFSKIGWVLAMLAATIAPAFSQGWFFRCIDPTSVTPYSLDFNTYPVFNSLFGTNLGIAGTVTYGGATGPCFAPAAVTVPVAGSFGFYYGNTGSVQSNFDDNLADGRAFPRRVPNQQSPAPVHIHQPHFRGRLR